MESIGTHWRNYYGMLRSRLIYDYKPFNQRRLKKFYAQFITEGSLCFDLGAHTGNRTHSWLRSGASVVAVEPHPVLARMLQKRTKGNPRAKVVEAAVSNKAGKQIFKMSSLYPSISTLSDEWTEVMQAFDHKLKWEKEIEVISTTLDELISTYGKPDFIKIDVEGYEVMVLKGLSAPIKSLSFEFFPTTVSHTIECIQHIEQLGKYTYNWSLTESLRMNSSKWLSGIEMQKIMLEYIGKKSGDIYAKLENKPV